ncbi:AMP-binding protein [Mycolicibacterium baixiangningiae]|uniref:AMP-binding protein n=1 Tax=Mycolicibacterium baixiangningiae TaxID=2761578 RepID=UPI0018696030|nr:AMP-binding protein [Mycolicibacterium baixiangningiae]
MAAMEPSIPVLLREQARQQPEAPAFTFIDHDVDPAGFRETLTWSQAWRRVEALAAVLAPCGSPGDRVAILAPQGLEYIIGFLAAMHAGYIAVPLSVPQFGIHDVRVSAALVDSAPVAVLTTSSVVDAVVPAVGAMRSSPSVIELDALDLDSAPVRSGTVAHHDVALLQYTSGSTRKPAGVVVTHRNVIANLDQVFSDYFEHEGKVAPAGLTLVSWLPFYHDMGLLLGTFAPVASGRHAVITSPMAFLQKPARWIQMLASHGPTFSAGPNFAFELAARRTSDADMAGLDLSRVKGIISGSERVHSATLRRFTDRFSAFGFRGAAMFPSYGLAEATLYVASSPPGQPPTTVRFDYEKLSAGHAKRCGGERGSELVSYGPPRACTVRIVDPDTQVENPAGKIGEIWIHGDNVAGGYWRNREASQRTFGAQLTEPSGDTPRGPWLRTGDLGVMSDGELFIVGRIKDLLIVDGRNHYPDDIEATIQEITGGRAAAISVPDDATERLVAIAEVKKRGSTEEEAMRTLHNVRRAVTSAVSKSHSVRVTDLVFVAPGSIPITTSGKVRRSACTECYRQEQFSRLDVGV